MNDDDLRTSWTLVARIKNQKDEASWRQFNDLYNELILAVARGSGLRDHEAKDVLQETLRSVFLALETFEANPDRGSFRSWLWTIAKRRVQDQLRKRLPANVVSTSPDTDTAGTPLVERVADSKTINFETIWDSNWKKCLLAEGLKELQMKVKAKDYQIFHLLVVQEKSSTEVANMVGRNRAQIYITKHRLAVKLSQIIRRLAKRLG